MVGRHSEMAAKRAFPKAKSHNVFGQARKSAKMFRASSLYVDRKTGIRHRDHLHESVIQGAVRRRRNGLG
jgi:hypothetical protein